jgi:hypothetical protein
MCSLTGRAGRRRSGGSDGGWVSLKPSARSGGEDTGMALYSRSHPAQVGGEDPPRNRNQEKSTRGPFLRDLLDGRVEPKPVFRRLLYGFSPFKRSLRHALTAQRCARALHDRRLPGIEPQITGICLDFYASLIGRPRITRLSAKRCSVASI